MQIYFLDDYEIHQIGNYVFVVWNWDEDKGRLTKEPYINFLYIKKYSNGIGVSEDSSVAGGIDVKQAETIIQELTEAVNYVKSLEETNETS